MTMTLEDFIKHWNEGGYGRINEFNWDNINWLQDSIGDAFVEVFGRHDRRPLSISKLYKPVFLLALDQLGYHEHQSSALRQLMHMMKGHAYEAIVLSLMYQYGLDIHELQKEVDFRGLTNSDVHGHIDLMYGDDTVIDIKAMSGNYYKTFTDMPNDNRGYVTQILSYKEALGIENAGILCIDSWFHGMKYIPISGKTWVMKDNIEVRASECLTRAHKVVDYFQEFGNPRDVELEDLEKLWEGIPKPYEYSKYYTNKMVPESFQYDSRRFCLYDIFGEQQKCVRETYEYDIVMDKLEKYRNMEDVR